MASSNQSPETNGEVETTPTAFQPTDRTNSPSSIRGSLPDEIWKTVLSSPCTFPPSLFSTVMLNLIKNPNITSSHLFRADIFYDSEKDHSIRGDLVSHLKAEFRPLAYDLPGFELTRTIVRQMVPRNPQLDRALVQTCHFFSRTEGQSGEEENVIVYLPHVDDPSELPFYHPAVSRLAFSHNWPSSTTSTTSSPHDHSSGTISLSYSLSPSMPTLTPKLHRTALRLLQTIHKHGQGQLRGYSKRVHLDQILPQKRYQDTYARLKAKYGKLLSESWVEVTDPGKHVFEDVGIAAWLVEVWGDMYDCAGREGSRGDGEGKGKLPFPGFVDIGCGNGILTFILLSEGYRGWGFDARERKTWSTFPPDIQAKLQRRLLVPSLFQTHDDDDTGSSDQTESHDPFQRGLFSSGTFIISNHADELTTWTPLLAYLNDAAFVAIPCCSHDLSGARFRAPATTKAAKSAPARLPQQEERQGTTDSPSKEQAAETGSLAKSPAQKKQPSAYSTLCTYVSSLAEELGFEAEKDVLRIPSTRNQCIFGRRRGKAEEERGGMEEKLEKVKGIVEREMGRSVQIVGEEWVQRARGLAKKPGSGH